MTIFEEIEHRRCCDVAAACMVGAWMAGITAIIFAALALAGFPSWTRSMAGFEGFVAIVFLVLWWRVRRRRLKLEEFR